MTRFGRRSFLLASAAALAGSCVAPLAGPSPSADRRGRLTLSWPTDTGYPSPFAFSTIGPGGIAKLMLAFDTLTWKDARGVVPWIAESWTAEDAGAAYRFRIRPDVVFHDGTRLDASDVAFTFEYFARHPFKWTSTAMVRSAQAVDGRTVLVRLDGPHAPFIEDVAGSVPILPRHIWETVADPLAFADRAATVGSGPFELASYADGKGEYLFRARDRHFAGVPRVSELAYVLVPNAQRTIALQTHTADVFLATEYDVAAAFGDGRPYSVFTTPAWSVMRLILNVDRPPLDDARVRRAVAHALDRGDIASRVTHAPDVVVGSAGLIPPESPWYRRPASEYTFDPQRARALLDDAGIADRDGDGVREAAEGRPLALELVADPAAPDGALVVAQLRAVGLAVRILAGDAKTRANLQQKRLFSLALTSHVGIAGDPDFLRQWFSGAATNAFAYGDAIHDPAFAAAADAQRRELDVARRRDLVGRMQDLLAADLVTLPLYYRRFYFIYDRSRWDTWFNTAGGLLNGNPLLENKLAFVAS